MGGIKCANDGVGGKISISWEGVSEASVEEASVAEDGAGAVLTSRGGPLDHADSDPTLASLIGIGAMSPIG
jgi:hypothetical protein